MKMKQSWMPRWLLLALLMCLSAAAHAQSPQMTATWTGAGNGTTWNDPANWSTANFPNNGTPAGTTYNVVIDANSGATANVILNVTVAIDSLTVNSGDSLSVNNTQRLTIINRGAGTNSGTITNSGAIAMNSVGNTTDLAINGDVTLNGGGSVTLSNTSANRILGSVATDRLTNVDNLIQGAGQIGVDLMALTNQGTIRANQTNALVIDPSASGVINNGILQASGGTLRLQEGSFTNTGATIDSQNASIVELTASTNIIGGTLTTTGDGAIRNVGTSTLANLTNAGNFVANNFTTTNLVGTITNNGVITMNSIGNTTDLIINGDVTLNGGGTVTLSNTSANRIYSANGTDRLTNVDNLIQGAGQIGVDLMALTNQGTIRANQTNALVIDPSAGGVSNSGLLEASGGTLGLANGSFTNTGATAVIIAQDASFVDLSGAVVTGPTLNSVGTGAIRNVGTSTLVNLTNAGNFAANNFTTTNLVGTITNNGVITMNSVGNTTDLIINGDVTLNGGGTVTLSNTSANRIYGLVNTDRLTNVDNLIQGAGQIGVDLMALTNQGTIRANQTNALVIDPAVGGVSNSGVLEASGGTLRLQDGSFTNTGIAIIARNASVVELSGATVIGGTLATAGSGAIRNVGTSTLANLTNAGNFVANNFTTTNLVGIITNNGVIALNSVGNATNLIINGDVTLKGGGSVTLGNSSANRIYGVAGTNRLTNAAGHTIQGAGNIGINLMALTNQGTIQANQSSALVIDPSASGFTTSGAVQVRAGSTLMMSGDDFNQTAGVTSVNGTLRVSNGTVLIRGGVLEGNGIIKANVINAGTVSPGTSPGLLTIDGNYTQTSAGTLLIEIGGPAPNSQYDQLVVTGAARLAGTLVVNLINGYGPPMGISFQFLTTGSSNNTGTLILRVMGPGSFAQDYDPNNASLVVMGGPTSNLGPNDDAYTLVLGPPGQAQQAGVVLQSNGIFLIRAPGVLANDQLTPNSKVELRVIERSKNGRFLLRSDGTLFYLPSPGRVGVDELSYMVSDGIKTVTARIRLNVVDRREPQLRVDTPLDRATLPVVTKIAGRVRDLNSGLKSLTLLWQRFDGKSWNGSAWTAAASELPLTVTGINWIYDGALPKPGRDANTALIDGRYDLRVTATDNSGNLIQMTNRIIVNTPVVPSTVRLSAVSIAAAQGTIALSFTGALDAAVASDKSHYRVAVKGVQVAVNAVSYAGNRVTLSGFTLAPGDRITLQITGLRDAGGGTLGGVEVTLVAA